MSNVEPVSTKPQKQASAVTEYKPAIGSSIIDDTARFEHAWRVARAFASSQLMPAHLRGKPEDVLIALHMAQQLHEDPLIICQSIYIISGKAGWSASYMIARANRAGVFKGRIGWTTTGTGKDLAVTARAVLAENGEEVSATATMQMAMAENWVKNAKYQTMPELMLRYRSATMLVRLYAPEVMLGLPVVDEIEDVVEAAAAPVETAFRTKLDAFAQPDSPVIDAEVVSSSDTQSEDMPAFLRRDGGGK